MDGRQLPCEREIGNSKDLCAVAVMENLVAGSLSVIVGHVPCLISTVCSIFIRRGGSLTCIVTGVSCIVSEDLPQGGLEIPHKYVFKTVESTESKKARAMIEDILAIKIPTIIQEASIEEAPKIPPTSMKTQAPMCGSELSREKTPTGTIVDVDDEQAKILSSLKDRDLPVFLDSEESCEPPSKKRKLSNMETERIIMGEELDDMHINLAFRLLIT